MSSTYTQATTTTSYLVCFTTQLRYTWRRMKKELYPFLGHTSNIPPASIFFFVDSLNFLQKRWCKILGRDLVIRSACISLVGMYLRVNLLSAIFSRIQSNCTSIFLDCAWKRGLLASAIAPWLSLWMGWQLALRHQGLQILYKSKPTLFQPWLLPCIQLTCGQAYRWLFVWHPTDSPPM